MNANTNRRPTNSFSLSKNLIPKRGNRSSERDKNTSYHLQTTFTLSTSPSSLSKLRPFPKGLKVCLALAAAALLLRIHASQQTFTRNLNHWLSQGNDPPSHGTASAQTKGPL